MFQTFRPIDGILSSYGHKKVLLRDAITQARRYPGTEIRIWGTLTVVWWSGHMLPDALTPSFKPALARVKGSPAPAAGGVLKATIKATIKPRATLRLPRYSRAVAKADAYCQT